MSAWTGAAIPRRLGYRLERVVAVPPEASAETGRQLEFVLRATEWRERRAARERDDRNAEAEL